MALNLHPLPPRPIPVMVKRAVAGCEDCELHDAYTAPIPFTSHPNPVFGVVGDWPDERDNKSGKVFDSYAALQLKQVMRKVKVPVNLSGWINIVNCYSSNRTTQDHIVACRGNFLAQRAALNTRVLLLVGANVLSYFRADLKITEVHGKVFTWDDRYLVMPVFAPGSMHKDPSKLRQMRVDLERFGELVSAVDYTQFFGNECIKCLSRAEHHDPDQVPYCGIHWKKEKRTWMKSRNKWDKKRAKGIQGKLL